MMLKTGRPCVSFTFDDFPSSALEAGGAILEASGVRGTFYLSGLLAAGGSDVTGISTADDVRTALERGHELGCHTFSHLDCSSAAVAAVAADVERNQAALQAVAPGVPLRHFAYPYGKVTRPIQRFAADRFDTARGIGRGINRGMVDAALLKANKLYGCDDVVGRSLALIEDVARRGGWLVFYTHDVSERPSRYGTATAVFEQVVRAAVAAGCTVAPVGETAKAVLTPVPATDR